MKELNNAIRKMDSDTLFRLKNRLMDGGKPNGKLSEAVNKECLSRMENAIPAILYDISKLKEG